MRTFLLVRTYDVSGVSGTGIAAEGIEFTDGAVALRRPHEKQPGIEQEVIQ